MTKAKRAASKAPKQRWYVTLDPFEVCIRAGAIPEGYPKSWPAPDRPNLLPPGTAPCTSAIMAEIRRRKARFSSMLADQNLAHFPRDEVREVLAFWKVTL